MVFCLWRLSLFCKIYQKLFQKRVHSVAIIFFNNIKNLVTLYQSHKIIVFNQLKVNFVFLTQIMNKFLVFVLFPVLTFGQSYFPELERLFINKEFNQAEVLITHYLETDSNNLEAIELLGDIHGYQKKWDEALDNYKKLIEANKNNANYHYKYAGVLGMKALENKLKSITYIGEAKNHFVKAANLNPKHIDARWALVELYIELPGFVGGSLKKALYYSNELENLSKVDGYLAKGYIYENTKQNKLAEKYQVMALQESDALDFFKELSSLEKNKDTKSSSYKLADIQENHQKNRFHYQLGKVAAQYNVELQKGEQNLQTYIKNFSAIDRIPKAWAHYYLARINVHKKNKDYALKHINLAITELPKIKSFKEEKARILNM